MFEHGEPSDSVALVVGGSVEVVRILDGKEHITGTMGVGEYVGQMGAIIGRARSETIRSSSDDTVIELLERDDFLHRIVRDPDSAYGLINRLGERLRSVHRRSTDVAVFDAFKAREIRARSHGLQTSPAASSAPKTVTLVPASEYLISQMDSAGQRPERYPFIIGRSPDTQEVQETQKRSQRFASGDRRTIGDRRESSRTGKVDRRTAPAEADLQFRDERPYRLSRLHFSIQEMGSGDIIVRDLGSTLGTRVNDDQLGVDFPKDFVALREGSNSIVAGGSQSPFIFEVVVELGSP